MRQVHGNRQYLGYQNSAAYEPVDKKCHIYTWLWLRFSSCEKFWKWSELVLSSNVVKCNVHSAYFLLLARYVPNVVNKSTWHQCIYWGPTDRPTDDRPRILENFEWPYLGSGSSDPLHVWFYGRVFDIGGSNGATSGWTKSKMAAGR